jgi:hypothetical protein
MNYLAPTPVIEMASFQKSFFRFLKDRMESAIMRQMKKLQIKKLQIAD